LKLLYFQRASKFVMKGEYEQALTEVRRVFVVDPENAIAREYATRVESLIEHARRETSSDPMPAAGEEPVLPEQRPSPAYVPPAQEESVREHSKRSTAWNDNFLAPKTVNTIPERRTAASSSRQTVAYGDSLAVALKVSAPDATESRSRKPVRRSSGKRMILVIALVTACIGGGAFAVFSTGKSAGRQAGPSALGSQDNSDDPAATGTLAVPPAQAEEPVAQAAPPVQDPPPHEAETPRASQKAKETAETVLHEATREPRAVAAVKPAPQTPAAEVSVPVPVENKPAAAEPTPVSPTTFIPVEKEPQIVKLEKPQFPSFVWKTGMEGQVIVRVLIDTDGKPLDTQILKSTSSVFEDGVIEAVMKSTFSPAQMGQGPVTAWLTIPFKFRQPK
jgi:protein TonB